MQARLYFMKRVLHFFLNFWLIDHCAGLISHFPHLCWMIKAACKCIAIKTINICQSLKHVISSQVQSFLFFKSIFFIKEAIA